MAAPGEGLFCSEGLPYANSDCPGVSRGSGDEERCAWRSWFATTLVPVWVEDFSRIAAYFKDLKASGMADTVAWLKAHPMEVRALATRVRVLDANAAAAELLKATEPEQLRGDLTAGFEDDSYDSFLEELISIARGERRFSVDILSRTFEGERRNLRMQWTAGAGHEDDLSVVFLSALDITELVRTEAELRNALKAKDFFLREIQHRVRNTLTLIDSLLSMQAQNRPESADMLGSLARRVDTLAVVHDSLYHRKDPSVADLRDCVEGAARQAFHREGGQEKADLELAVEELDLPIEAATPVALIVGELTANAIRYGAEMDARARVRVDAGRAADGRVSIRVRDGGVGMSPESRTAPMQGLGLSLVYALASQLKASLEWEEGGGLDVRIVFPVKP